MNSLEKLETELKQISEEIFHLSQVFSTRKADDFDSYELWQKWRTQTEQKLNALKKEEIRSRNEIDEFKVKHFGDYLTERLSRFHRYLFVCCRGGGYVPFNDRLETLGVIHLSCGHTVKSFNLIEHLVQLSARVNPSKPREFAQSILASLETKNESSLELSFLCSEQHRNPDNPKVKGKTVLLTLFRVRG